MKTISLLVCALLLLGAPLLAGCGPREHLRPDHGKSYRAFGERQRISPHAASGSPIGLDSEEASMIHSSYRKEISKSSDAEQQAGSQVLVVPERGRDAKGR